MATLDLTHAFKKVEHARQRCDGLLRVFNAWREQQGIKIICERDPQRVLYVFYAGMQSNPSQDLGLLCGEVIHSARGALDFVAWQIYVAGGGNPYDRRAKSVYFPVVETAQQWPAALRQNVPGAWPAAERALYESQPFVQGANADALPVLCRLSATDKHRHINVFAVSNDMELGATAPAMDKDHGLMIVIRRPGPELELGVAHEFGRVFVFKTSDSPPGLDDAVPWSSGIKLELPPPPDLTLGFRSSDAELELASVRPLIEYVAEIITKFSNVEVP